MAYVRYGKDWISNSELEVALAYFLGEKEDRRGQVFVGYIVSTCHVFGMIFEFLSKWIFMHWGWWWEDAGKFM